MNSQIFRSTGIFLLSIFVMILCGIFSCRHVSKEIDLLDEVCFESEILPIFQTSCAISGCHDQGGESGYIFTSYTNIIKAVVPGKPEARPAYTSLIKIWAGEGMMPPGQPLSEYNRTLIRVWIHQGAKNTTCQPIDSLTYENPRACFQRDILPVLLSSCAIIECHDAITAKEGYKFVNYSNTLKAVNISNPTESKLYRMITQSSSEDIMPPPPYNPLPRAQIDSILSWIQSGALNEFCGEVCDTVSAMSFETNIWPIIVSSCKGCHSGGNPSGGITLTNYSDLAAVASSGELIGAIQSKPTFKPMPPSGPLSACKIRQIDLWVQDGYLNN